MYHEMITQKQNVAGECFLPKIKVVGLGGGGSNAVDRMITVGIPGVEYIAANTDRQSLSVSEAPIKVQLGPQVTRGLGAGGKAEVGREAALESEDALRRVLEGASMVFIAAGMGGGTGTGAAPVAARIARELGALTIGVVTLPFAFEGTHRARSAQAGVQELSRQVHTLVKVQNDRLLEVAPRDLRLEVAFRVADDILRQGIQGITELVTQTGIINLDFANIESVIRQGGSALMAIGRGNDVEQAANAALRHPLLEHDSIDRATALLVHVSGGADMGLMEVNQAMTTIIQSANPAADVLFGAHEDPEMEGRAQVILIATGIKRTGTESIAVQSLFGVPAPASDEKEETVVVELDQDLGIPVPQSTLDIPAFMRRRELFGSLGTRRREVWAAS
jgi:cell division protein FtsZ